MAENLYDVLILGGGPAGLTAALYTSRASMKTLIIAGAPAGGQLMLTSDVENYPGFPEGILGPQLVQKFMEQSVKFGAGLVEENVTEISGEFPKFTVKTHTGSEYFGKTVIIATGATSKWLDLESVKRLRGRGVSSCATCDGFFFRGKTVAVVGGGDSAMEESLFLTKFATKVYILVRSGEAGMKASKIMHQRAKDNSKIEFMFNTEIKEVLGQDMVEGLTIFNNQTNEEKNLDDVKGLFMAIGHEPNTDFLKGFLELGTQGYLIPTDNTKTSKQGVFVAGDVSDWKYRQAVTAAGLGCMAAIDAERFLDES